MMGGDENVPTRPTSHDMRVSLGPVVFLRAGLTCWERPLGAVDLTECARCRSRGREVVTVMNIGMEVARAPREQLGNAIFARHAED